MCIRDSCNNSGIDFLRELEEAEGALVAGSGADDAIEAGDGFGVVVEDFGAGIDDEADGFFVALKVGDEDFDLAAGSLAADFVDNHDEGAGSSDDVVVAIDAGDDGEFESELGDGFGNAARLVKINRIGAAFGDGAESAAAGAEVAEHHEGGGAAVSYTHLDVYKRQIGCSEAAFSG